MSAQANLFYTNPSVAMTKDASVSYGQELAPSNMHDHTALCCWLVVAYHYFEALSDNFQILGLGRGFSLQAGD